MSYNRLDVALKRSAYQAAISPVLDGLDQGALPRIMRLDTCRSWSRSTVASSNKLAPAVVAHPSAVAPRAEDSQRARHLTDK